MHIEIEFIIFVALVIVMLLVITARLYSSNKCKFTKNNVYKKTNLQVIIPLIGTIIAVYVTINVILSILEIEAKQHIIRFLLWIVITQLVSSIMTIHYTLPYKQQFMLFSSSDSMIGELYEKIISVFIAIISCITLITEIASKLSLLLNIVSRFLCIVELSMFWKSVIIGIFLYFCTKVSSLMNILHFFVIGVGLPALALFTWIMLGKWSILVSLCKMIYIFSFNSIIDISSMLMLLNYCLLIFSSSNYIYPSLLQTVLLTKNLQQMNTAIIAASIIAVKCILLFIFIFISLPNTYNYQITHITSLNYIVLIIILTLVAVLIIIILVINYTISALVIILVKDVCKPLGVHQAANFAEIKLTKMHEIVILLFIAFISAIDFDWLNIILTMQTVYTSIVGVALIMAIFNIRSTNITILLGMLSSSITIIVFFYLLERHIPIVSIIAILVNLAVVISLNYVLRYSKPKNYYILCLTLVPRYKIKTKLNNIYHSSRDRIINMILDHCLKDSYIHSSYYVYYALLIILLLLVMWVISNDFILFCKIKIASFITMFAWFQATIIMLHKLWPTSCRKYLRLTWYFSAFYALVSLSTMLLVLSANFIQVSSIFFVANIVIAGILVRPQVFILMLIFGIPLGIWTAKIFNLKVIHEPIT